MLSQNPKKVVLGRSVWLATADSNSGCQIFNFWNESNDFFKTCAQSYINQMQLFEQKKCDGQWTRAGFLRQIFSKNELFSKILAFFESAQWAGWKNGLTFLIWWTLSFDLFLARARQLKLVKYHSLTHLRLFSMLSDAKLWHFEVITPHQYYGYPWCTTVLLLGFLFQTSCLYMTLKITQNF